ncbi:MCFD2 [Branchiostoma lanceolatum]|uniref:MCFD2 protein n=1 Tax=Branchiostoma lanceolatum TaxID=7740 RepID=A0A8J9VAB5_BRALA|nr:MCFD2 [Branchiostoma lanceolatum]
MSTSSLVQKMAGRGFPVTLTIRCTDSPARNRWDVLVLASTCTNIEPLLQQVIHKSHLKEHVKELTEEQINEMSSEEKEFHFFKTHDSDKDLKLDGLEILAAIEHSTHFNTHEDKDMTEYYAELVDKVLVDDDPDDDGMISWIEYVVASRRREVEAEAAHARKQKVA